jgi:predicted lipoprotein
MAALDAFRRRHGASAGAAWAVVLAGVTTGTQAAPPVVAVPFYDAGHFVQGLHRDLTAPAARRFADGSGALVGALRAHCDPGGAGSLAEARRRWTTAVAAWERLSALAVGPLLERRSLRAIDFAPARPALIERAIAAQPQGVEGMERVGTPAKGLPALEWLLWTRPAQRGTPACAYAVEVAADVDREAQALAGEFAALAGNDWNADESAGPAMAEALNQWLGGIERLRWAQMERPLRAEPAGPEGGDAGAGSGGPGVDRAGGATGTSPGAEPAEAAAASRREPGGFPRQASGQTAAAWSAEWDTLRRLGRAPAGREPPRPGEGLVPFETYLRGRGLNPQADALRRAVDTADAALRGLAPASRPRVLAAARALDALGRLVESQVAPALQVSIGFSDADGD